MEVEVSDLQKSIKSEGLAIRRVTNQLVQYEEANAKVEELYQQLSIELESMLMAANSCIIGNNHISSL